MQLADACFGIERIKNKTFLCTNRWPLTIAPLGNRGSHWAGCRQSGKGGEGYWLVRPPPQALYSSTSAFLTGERLASAISSKAGGRWGGGGGGGLGGRQAGSAHIRNSVDGPVGLNQALHIMLLYTAMPLWCFGVWVSFFPLLLANKKKANSAFRTALSLPLISKRAAFSRIAEHVMRGLGHRQCLYWGRGL